MKFKTKEELKSEAFESFAERVAFYKKYAWNHGLLFEEQYKLYKYWLDERSIGVLDDISLNKWLFDYCFGDIE